jgi:hypothetical protein
VKSISEHAQKYYGWYCGSCAFRVQNGATLRYAMQNGIALESSIDAGSETICNPMQNCAKPHSSIRSQMLYPIELRLRSRFGAKKKHMSARVATFSVAYFFGRIILRKNAPLFHFRTLAMT